MSERINPLDHPERYTERSAVQYTPAGARHHITVYNGLERKVEVYAAVEELASHHEVIRVYKEGDEVGTASTGFVYRHTDLPTDTSYCGIPCEPINDYVGIPGNGSRNWKKWRL